MTRMDLNQATTTTYETSVPQYQLATMSTDGVQDQKETRYQNSSWPKQWGAFNTVPNLYNALLLKGIWLLGNGFECDNLTRAQINHINGSGKDTFEDILFNLYITSKIGGDAYAEIRREDNEDPFSQIINLMPLDPETIAFFTDRSGKIIRYEQTLKGGTDSNKAITKFKPHQILHIQNNRLADQIHGISQVDVLERVIRADQSTFTLMDTVMMRQVVPMIMFKIKSDDAGKIAKIKADIENSRKKGEDLLVPDDENILSWEVVQISPSQMILEWRNDVRNEFYRTVGLPQIIPGAGGQSTESEGKVIYLAHEQIAKFEQRLIERLVFQQLGWTIHINPPVSLQAELSMDQAKDKNAQMVQTQMQGAMNGQR